MGLSADIRAYEAGRRGAQKARIRRTGEVEVYGTMPNTSIVGWYSAGWREDILRQMAAEAEVSGQQRVGNAPGQGQQRVGNAPGQGRQATIAPGAHPVVVRAMVSPKQRDAFFRLGGSAWLRRAIDAESLPDTA